MISAKIANQATLLRRNGRGVDPGVITELRSLARASRRATSDLEILGVEGAAASIYFSEFSHMLSAGAPPDFRDQWEGRSGRKAQDPLNSALNYCYGMLLHEVSAALLSCGLDPHDGILHSPGRNKPALALDLMEEFRAPIADSVVLSCINNGEISPGDFTSAFGDARLTDEARRSLIRKNDQRLATEIRHPLFGYPASWRRIIEIQARLLLGVANSSHDRYTGVRTR